MRRKKPSETEFIVLVVTPSNRKFQLWKGRGNLLPSNSSVKLVKLGWIHRMAFGTCPHGRLGCCLCPNMLQAYENRRQRSETDHGRATTYLPHLYG